MARRRDGSTQRGRPIMPWGRPAPPPHPELARFSTPRPYEPHIAEFRDELARGRAQLPHVPPTVGARARTPRVERALATLRVFDAVQTDATAYDASIAVGPSDVVVTTNYTAAVLTKTGGPPLETSLRAWFAQVLPPEVDVVFDPRVLYDQHDDRWVLVASAVHYDDFTRPFLLLSVSQTSDPRRDWWVWGLAEPGGDAARWPDHPSLGVDAHALYVSANLFKGLSRDPAIGRLRVLPKAMPYEGGPPSYTEFEGLQNPTDEDHPHPTPALTVFPCHTWDAPGVEMLVSTRKDLRTERTVTLWTLTDPAGEPELTCRSLAVAPYAIALPLAAQQGGPTLSTGDARVRNAVFCNGSIWFAFATAHQAEATVAAARWYQVNPGSARVVQEGHFAVTHVHHCYPALVPDMQGNATLVVGRAAADERASLHVTSRHSSDPPGELPPSRPVHDGMAVHDNPDRWERNRWGDYHGAALDPVDGATVWVYGAYPLTEKVWGTSVGALRV